MGFNYIPGAPEGSGSPEHRDIARQKAESQIPMSERLRAGYGSLLMSLQSATGLCEKTRKCLLKDGHAVPCWPGD